MRRAWLLVGAVMLVVAGAGFAPLPVRPVVKPGQVATSRPDRHGLVTQLRPVVTRLAPDDPFRVALHWAKEKGPLRRGDVPGTVGRDTSLLTMTFALTTPDGKTQVLRPAGAAGPLALDFFWAPTYLLTLTKDGLDVEGGKKWPWAGGMRPELTREGVYRLEVKGELLRPGMAPIPFQSEPILLEVRRAVLPQARALESARAAMRRAQPGVDLARAQAFFRDDEKGNTLVRFRTRGRVWSFNDWTVTVRPDGKAEAPALRTVSNCVARGTPIATEKGPRPVEQVRVGDRVWAYDARTRRRVLTAVRAVRLGEAHHTIVLGGRLRVTAEHPVWAGEWKPAEVVAETDLLLDEGLRAVPAGRARWVSGRVQVFDLTVGEPHCFFAAGFLVHNKDRDYWPHVDDPWYDRWR
jgi:hypothetical protein